MDLTGKKSVVGWNQGFVLTLRLATLVYIVRRIEFNSKGVRFDGRPFVYSV